MQRASNGAIICCANAIERHVIMMKIAKMNI
jgi:hypothetical protein